jgi:rhodanese-related sulfurtransferase
VQGDTLILLDVREIAEYMNGHIAEPDGQLPLTPVLMPWNSSVLSSEFSLLPTDVDIIVYCQSGGRSAAASAFLDAHGYSRIFNMLGGFSSWSYENRPNGFGNHSGKWVNPAGSYPVEIICIETGDTSRIIFPPTAYPETDSIYIELHLASFKPYLPPDVPQSDLDGLFRITVLNHRGLSIFEADSLNLSGTANLSFHTDIQGNIIFYPDLTIYIPGRGWQSVEFEINFPLFVREETVLRKWYNAAGFLTTSADEYINYQPNLNVEVFPNPFNSTIQISAPEDAVINIFDIMGRLIKRLDSNIWIPENSIGSGIYFVIVRSARQIVSKKVVYLK